jgi:hypothetical protein
MYGIYSSRRNRIKLYTHVLVIYSKTSIYRYGIYRSLSVVVQQILFYISPRIYRFPVSIVVFQDPRRKRRIDVRCEVFNAVAMKNASSRMLRRVVLIRTDVLEERGSGLENRLTAVGVAPR